jgi:hypothetical protein
MKALIVGYGNSLTHERAVKSIYDQYGVGDSAICMLNASNSLLEESDVDMVINSQSNGYITIFPGALKTLINYLNDNPNEYDLILISYVNIDYAILKYIPIVLGIPVFVPVINERHEMIINNGDEQSLIFVGRGITSNLAGYTLLLDCYDNQSSTSLAVPMVAGKFSKLLNQGLTAQQATIALFKSCDNYSNWDFNDGFGKVPNTIPIPENYLFTDKSAVNNQVSLPQNYDANSLVYFENPVELEDEAEEDEGVTEEEEVVEEETEEEVVEEVVEEIVETINDSNESESNVVIVPTPTKPSLARSSETVTVTPNETATKLKLYRKTRIEDDWELVGTTSESTISDDTTDADKNYIYAVKIANSETESDYSEPAYIAGTDFGGVMGGLL